MPDETIYIADTSALIEIQQKYPHDVFGGLWKNLSGLAKNGKMIAPRHVFDEIKSYALEDYLKTWATQHKNMFKEPTPAHYLKVKEILASFPNLINTKSEFEQADPYVVAMALCVERQTTLVGNIRVVVTEESFTKPQRIPDVCRNYSITCINTIEMFRQEGWRFE